MRVVEKSWGREEIHVNTDLYCLKTLHVDAGQRCSLHHHLRKDETFVVTNGECILEHGGQVRRMVLGEQVRIFPGTSHRFGTREGCVIHEVSTHHDDADVVRHDPSGPMPPGWGEFTRGISDEDVERLASVRLAADRGDYRVVLASGCFDLLHAGHEDFLRRASAMGGRLVVALNSDASVRRLKGHARPIVPAEHRAAMLRALRWVNHVVEFDADDPRCVAEALRPDVVVKGADWRGRPVPEADRATLVILPEVVLTRTSAVVERLRTAAPT